MLCYNIDLTLGSIMHTEASAVGDVAAMTMVCLCVCVYCALYALRSLTLNSNQLTGSIPNGISALANVVYDSQRSV